MQFITEDMVNGLNFSMFEPGQIAAAIDIVMSIRMPGPYINDDVAKELAVTLRTKMMCPMAMTYLCSVKGLTQRIVTPFNVETLLAERHKSYGSSANVVEVSGLHFERQACFLNYKQKEHLIEELLPGTKAVKFDPVFALNVSLAASVTRYVVDKQKGIVVPVTPPEELYKGAPYEGMALAASFSVGVGGDSSLQGAEWAHCLYSKFYESRVQFNKAVAAYTRVSSHVRGADGQWTKLFKPSAWTAFRPMNNVERISSLARLQGYRGKDTRGLSAMSYAAYGEDFGTQYRLAEKVQNFEIFLNTIPTSCKTSPLRVMTKDEREMVTCQMICKEWGLNFVHYFGRALNDQESLEGSPYDYKGQIIYDPKCATAPYTGKLDDTGVTAYINKNMVKITNRIAKYAGADHVGIRAHVIGAEKHVVGMGAPHNAVGVIVMGHGLQKNAVQKVWTLIMIAGHVRNTFVYTRKTVSDYLGLVEVMNEKRKATGEPLTVYMEYNEMRRPPWYAFTKEQRRHYTSLLRVAERFGEVPDDISDLDLAKLVEVAYADESFVKNLAATVTPGSDLLVDVKNVKAVPKVQLPESDEEEVDLAEEEYDPLGAFSIAKQLQGAKYDPDLDAEEEHSIPDITDQLIPKMLSPLEIQMAYDAEKEIAKGVLVSSTQEVKE
jgi:hypothetical protein